MYAIVGGVLWDEREEERRAYDWWEERLRSFGFVCAFPFVWGEYRVLHQAGEERVVVVHDGNDDDDRGRRRPTTTATQYPHAACPNIFPHSVGLKKKKNNKLII